MNGIRKVNNISEHMHGYGNDKPLNNPFGTRADISGSPENSYSNNPSTSYNQNGRFGGQQMDFYNWGNNSSDNFNVGGTFSLNKNDNTNSFNILNNANHQFSTYGNDNFQSYSTPHMMNGTGIQGGMGGMNNVSSAPGNNMLNFGNNTSQLVMGIVSNTVKETTGLNSEKISQLQLWFPQTIASLRSHFAVSHEYVLKKIFLIICPFITFFTQSKKPFSYENHTSISSNANDGGACLPTLFSDLYIPLMGFITYVLADGVINGVFSQFNPQILGSTATFSIVLLITEIILFQLVAYIFSARVLSTLDLISTLGYKYTSIVLCDFVLLSTGGIKTHVFWGLFIYFSISSSLLVYMMLKVISTQSFSNQFSMIQQSGLTIVIFISSLAQIPLCWILLPSI
ncbi:uncharacterized protein cubi_01762 [Cryptosporidium ubiquitum]|uniref:Protein YIF1 n=1 Tax=Cryptosporidium ubiquitum TaxID=857276 RepID=A0A1J4MBC7_9CRYT|nr:uncharacterized protein cubi_01762 [Cryptosporidium ubiquitum]OII71287.1 hypothetical protein cubi_01762 [Cryptosporidium ubiquitum]